MFQAHVREARNIKDYVEGPWVKDELLEEAISTGQQDKGAMSPVFTSRSQFAGQSRKVRFEQAGSGGILKAAYANEEVQRCIEAIEGEGYLLYCCISTNAPYGDRVRIVLKYRSRPSHVPLPSEMLLFCARYPYLIRSQIFDCKSHWLSIFSTLLPGWQRLGAQVQALLYPTVFTG